MMTSPATQLRIDVGDVSLVVPTDTQLAVLARQAATPGAVLPEDQTHYVKWIDGRSPEVIEQQRIDRVRSNRDLTTGPGWTLDLAIVVGGSPVGLQSLSGFEQWPHRRIVGSEGFAVILSLSVMGLVFYWLTMLLESRIVYWRGR